MIRLAVFDLDGTLVDSRRDLANAANALVAGLGGRPLSEEAIGRMVGEGAAVLVRRVLTAANLDPDAPGALPRFLELYDERLTEHTVPYGGIVEALDALAARMPLAVLTNKPQRATDRLLGSLELAPYFGRVVGGDSMLGRKPEPAGLLSLCTGAGVLPDEAILIGDSPVDLETARRAGTQVLLVSYGFGFRFDPAALETLAVADAPSEIPKHIAS
jgi:phosphoglycolate phosphatase